MRQLVHVLLAIGKAHTVPQRALDCRPGLSGLKHIIKPIVIEFNKTNKPSFQ